MASETKVPRITSKQAEVLYGRATVIRDLLRERFGVGLISEDDELMTAYRELSQILQAIDR